MTEENKDQNKKRSGVSRREFITGTVGGVVVGAVVGAAAGSLGFPKTITQTLTQTTTQTSVSTVQPGMPAKWDYSADVVVLGAGIAGLTSAIEAATQGAKVILLEKDTQYVGGNFINQGGQFTTYGPTSVQKQLGTVTDPTLDNAANYYDVIAWGREPYEDLDLVKLVVAHSNEAFEWTINTGGNTYSTVGNGSWPKRVPVPPRPWVHNSTNGGYGAAQAFKAKCDALGVTTMMGVRATGLVSNASGTVVGVEASTASQSSVYFSAAKGVIIATGGWAWNQQMAQQYSSRVLGSNPYASRPTLTGDGITMGQAVGADLWGMEWTSLSSCCAKPLPTAFIPPRLPNQTHPAFPTMSGAVPAIWVDAHGNRFWDETDADSYKMHLIVGLQDQVAWMVFDSKALPSTGATAINAYFNQDISTEVAAGYVTQANTILDLANAIGISPASNLVNTVNNYNTGAASKQDPLFGKPSASVSPIVTPPFYATAIKKANLFTYGGLKTDTSARVIDIHNNPIPGLFAVGATTGGYMTEWYPVGGITFPELTTLGRIAGRNAALGVAQSPQPWSSGTGT